jgi:predicted peptidase
MPSRLWMAAGLVLTASLVTYSLSAADEPPAAGRQVASQATVKVIEDGSEREATVRFWLALPADYDRLPNQHWPLVLFLHGAGERGEELELVKKHGPPKLAAAGRDFPFVLISPQCASGSRWNPHELAKLIEHAAGSLRIDRDRIYVTGLSMGGSGTWSLLAEYPGLAAAAIPICGRGDVAAAAKMTQTPIWIFIGGKDRAETVQNCQDMAAALKAAGGDAKLTLYPDLPHDCWTVTYDNPEVYEWLLAQRLRRAK